MSKPSPSSGISELKQAILGRLNIAAYYEKYTTEPLRSSDSEGWSQRVLCPIHKDTKTPQFFVNLVNGSYKCHACGAGGSVFDFWLDRHGMDVKDKRNFRHALVGLATEAGIDIKKFQKDFTQGQQHTHLPPAAKQKTLDGKAEGDAEDYVPKLNKAEQMDLTRPPIPLEAVKAFQAHLMRDHFIYLNEKRGLKKRTIDECMIGFDPSCAVKERDTGKWTHGRYTIPIPNVRKEIRNLRMYSPIADPKFKMVNYVQNKDTPQEQGWGAPPRLYGIHKITPDTQHIVVCEGEFDAILLNQMLEDHGMKTWVAVSGTHGANSFEAEWLPFFFGKNVYFCYDCDEPGKSGAVNHVNEYFLRGIELKKFSSVKIVTLPLDGSKEMKDITDYFMKANLTITDFLRTCEDTPETIIGGLMNDDASVEPIEVSDFVAAVKDRQYIDQRIRVPISISGTTSKVYHAIRAYTIVRCPLMEESADKCCSTLSTERTIAYGHQLFIESCMTEEHKILKSLSRIACQHEANCSVKATKKVVMEEYFAHQVVERWRAEEDEEGRMQNSQELVQTSIYVLQPDSNMPIEPQNYMATGYIRTHPKTSIATFFVENMVAMEEDWRKFSMNDELNRQLISTVKSEFTTEEIIGDIVNGVTCIYEMDEILYAVLLTYLTPLWIRFNGRIERGWLNVAIIGDSGTGKSATYSRLSDWLSLGDVFSALSGSRTGLLYAIRPRAGEWQVSIGRYVQASCRIIAVDEAQEITAEDIKTMAKAMDEGYLKIDRVASGGYHTTTRLLFMMNPKDNYGKAATMANFPFGCDALRICLDPMFIRRLDLAVFTTGKQEFAFFNQMNTKEARDKKNIRLTPTLMKSLVYWAWSRRPDQVIWSDESTQACLDCATAVSKEYGDTEEVPLALPQDFRLKLARMSVAYAILERSFSEDLESVIVTKKHVQDVARLINTIYSETACSLRYKSKQARARNHLDDYEAIKKGFEQAISQAKLSNNPQYRDGNYFLRFIILLQSMGTARKRDLAEQMNVNPNWVSKRLAILQSFNMLEVVRYGYKTTSKFNLFMRKWTSDPEIEKLIQAAHDNLGKQALEGDDANEIYGGGQRRYQKPIEEDEAVHTTSLPDADFNQGYDEDPFQ